MATLKEAIRKMRNPEAGNEDALRAGLETIKGNAQKSVDQAIKQAHESAIFGNLEPARKLASDTAQKEINSFKKDTTESVQNTLAALEKAKTDILAQVETQIGDVIDRFTGDLQSSQEAVGAQISEQATQHGQTLETLSGEARSAVQSLLADTRAQLDQLAAQIETMRGPQGETGAPGQAGKDGSSDTPQEIAGKLNTLEGAVNISVIKGLKSELSTLRQTLVERSSDGGGGGMGNTQHESKSVTSASTSVSTNYPIAANGYAIWAYYQGQLIVRGVHYTVGTNRKTLSLLFTPDNSTTIDIVYIRG